MNQLKMNSVSSASPEVEQTASKPTLKCARCGNQFSASSLHNGFCFICSVENFKKSRLKKLGFAYIPVVLRGKYDLKGPVFLFRSHTRPARRVKCCTFQGWF